MRISVKNDMSIVAFSHSPVMNYIGKTSRTRENLSYFSTMFEERCTADNVDNVTLFDEHCARRLCLLK